MALAAGAFASASTPPLSSLWSVCVLYHSVPQQEHFEKNSLAGAIVPLTPAVLSFRMVGDPDDNDNNDDNLMTEFSSGDKISSFSPPHYNRELEDHSALVKMVTSPWHGCVGCLLLSIYATVIRHSFRVSSLSARGIPRSSAIPHHQRRKTWPQGQWWHRHCCGRRRQAASPLGIPPQTTLAATAERGMETSQSSAPPRQTCGQQWRLVGELAKPPVVTGQRRRKTNNECAVVVAVPSTKVLAIVVGCGGDNVLVIGGCHHDIAQYHQYAI